MIGDEMYGNGPQPEDGVHFDIRQWRLDYYPKGELRKWGAVLEPSIDFQFYDDEAGFGGVVTASSFEEAQEKVLTRIAECRGCNREVLCPRSDTLSEADLITDSPRPATRRSRACRRG